MLGRELALKKQILTQSSQRTQREKITTTIQGFKNWSIEEPDSMVGVSHGTCFFK
jgi:hypothetical protein